MNKKGATGLTIFVILGIVVLVGVGGVFYVSQQTLEVSKTLSDQREEVPLQVGPVQTFVEQCIQRLGVSALQKAGMHGGYIFDSDLNALQVDRRYLTRQSDALYYDLRDKDTKVPYWHTIDCTKDPEIGGNCQFNSKRPNIDKIKLDLAKYIDDGNRLTDCLGNYSDFAEVYDIETEINPSSKIDFSDNEMIVNTNFKITLTSKVNNDEFVLNFFNLKIPTKFKQMYDIASELSEEQRNRRLVERSITEDWLDGYSNLRPNRLAPKYKFDIENAPVHWSIENIKDNFNIIMHNQFFNNIQVKGSQNYEDPYDFDYNGVNEADSEIKVYNNMIFLNQTPLVRNFELKFQNDPDWPLYFKINGKDAGSIGPQSSDTTEIIKLMNPIQINEYINFYSIEFPLIVKIQDPDPDELFDNSFTFMFAWQAKIANNNPVNVTNPFDDTFRTDNQISSLFGDVSTWNQNVNLIFVDQETRMPVPDITASICGFKCIPLEYSDENGTVKGLPSGQGLELKMGYDENYVLMDTWVFNITPDDIIDITIPLKKLKQPKKIELKKQYIEKDQFYYCFENNYCRQSCPGNVGVSITSNFCVQECMKDNDIVQYKQQYLSSNRISNINECNYNVTVRVCQNNNPNQCQLIDKQLKSTANSIPYWAIREKEEIEQDKYEEVVVGEYKNSENVFTTFGLTYGPIAEDSDIKILQTDGLIDGTYKMQFVYDEDDYNYTGIETEADLDNFFDTVSPVTKVSALTFDQPITSFQYNNMEDLKMKINVPVIVTKSDNELVEMADYIHNYSKLPELNNQQIFNTIVGPYFPKKPAIKLELPAIQFETTTN